MLQVNSNILINRPLQQVFDFISDFENAPKWQTGVVTSHKVTAGPVRVGTRFEEDVRLVLWKIKSACIITEVEPGRSFSFSAGSRQIDYQGRFTFEPVGESTRVTIEARGWMKGTWRLLEPLFTMDAKNSVKKELARARKALEAGPPSATQTARV
jgi:uncharacterized membrane protein